MRYQPRFHTRQVTWPFYLSFISLLDSGQSTKYNWQVFYILNIVITVKTSGFSSSLVSMLQEQASGQNPPLSAEDQKFRGGNSIFLDQHNKDKILSYVSSFYS